MRSVAACLAVAALFLPLPAAAQTSPLPLTVSLQTQSAGNTAFSYLAVTSAGDSGESTRAVPPYRIPGCRYWSTWTLFRLNPMTHARTYGVYIYDGCNHDAQVFPVPTDPREGSCNNDDQLFPSGKFSVCPILPEGNVPAGLPFDRNCEALTEADTSLFVSITPASYDASKPTMLTVTTSFASDTTQRLAEGTCTDVLDWEAVAWTLRWSDGSVDHLPASGKNGITASHHLAPASTAGPQQSDVTVVARLHVTGRALDFDSSGNLVVRRVDGYVDVSNHDGAAGAGSAPLDEPPQLILGAVAEGQDGDGTLPQPDPAATPAPRAVTIRGRLLALYLRPIVVTPGVELIDGVQVGTGTSGVIRWRYMGHATDAPPSEGTTPGASGDAGTPVVVQYDHAERIDGAGNPVDESVPLMVTIRTIYPDGGALDTTLDTTIPVAIWYAGLSGTG